jgi:hypothetical protein
MLPTEFSQLVILIFIIASFGAFIVTLLTVSLWVTLGQRVVEPPVERSVTPARQIEPAAAAGA